MIKNLAVLVIVLMCSTVWAVGETPQVFVPKAKKAKRKPAQTELPLKAGGTLGEAGATQGTLRDAGGLKRAATRLVCLWNCSDDLGNSFWRQS